MKKITLVFFLSIFSLLTYSASQKEGNVVWNIGKADHSALEFALAPNGFKNFISRDFGYEDKYFLVGHSKEKKDFPYVIPGPVDTWGGTWPTSGWRTNQVNILFGVQTLPVNGDYKLVLNLLDYAKKFLPKIKISINGQDEELQLGAVGYDVNKQPYPKQDEAYVDTASITGDLSSATPQIIEIPIKQNILKKGGNVVTITVLEGSWILFDQVKLEGSANLVLEKPDQLFISEVKAADYELKIEGGKVQPLLIDAKYLKGSPKIRVELDGKTIFKEKLEKGYYEFEAPMPAVEKPQKSNYRIYENGKLLEEDFVYRSKQKEQTLADYVDTRMGTAHSRWMIAPGPWMPFSMVKMSPDNQNAGWQAGYQPSYESVGTFSHIHEWTLGGLGIFATNGKL
ncbi:MAG TPA: polysaccharide lyase family protein, partial [Bacteroidales bacterium]